METPPAPVPSVPSIPQPEPQTQRQTPKPKRFSTILIVILLLVGLVVGGIVGYAVSFSVLNGKINTLQSALHGYTQNATYISYPNATYLVGGNTSLPALYQQVRSSVVIIQDLVPAYSIFGGLIGYSEQQGSGFITTVNNQQVIVTNNHVIEGATNETVTFPDGNSYPAKVLGADPLSDLAVLSINPMPSGLVSLTLASSETLQIGQPVVAVGSPYGLLGTLTTGVISALGRTITESSSSNQNGLTIPDIVQTSTAINPGNSGGPLLNYEGNVVAMTTATVTNSQGLVFAIPSDTITRELSSLVTAGSYNNHPSIGVTGTDMNFPIAQAMGDTVTYGFLVESVTTQNGLKGGNTQTTILGSTVIIGGDIVIAINGVRIATTDDLLSYLEQHTLPGQTANFTVIRSGQTQTVSVTIGKLS